MIYLIFYIIGIILTAVYLMKYEEGEENPVTIFIGVIWPFSIWFFILNRIALYIYRKIK